MWGYNSPTQPFGPLVEEEAEVDTEGVSSSTAHGLPIEEFMQLFISATPGGIEGVLRRPGSAGLSVLLASGGIRNDVKHVQQVISDLGWDESHDYEYEDFRDLGVMLGVVEANKEKAKQQEEAQELNSFLDCIEEASKSQDAEEISWVLDFVRQVEYVEIQSFVEKYEADYFQDYPPQADVSLKVAKAQWVRDSYCSLVLKYYVKKFVEEGIVSHRFEGEVFLPIISVNSSRAAQGGVVAREIVTQLKPNDLNNVDNELQDKWKAIRSALEGLNPDVLALCENFFLTEYYPTMGKVIAFRKRLEESRELVPKRQAEAEKKVSQQMTGKASGVFATICDKKNKLLQQVKKEDCRSEIGMTGLSSVSMPVQATQVVPETGGKRRKVLQQVKRENCEREVGALAFPKRNAGIYVGEEALSAIGVQVQGVGMQGFLDRSATESFEATAPLDSIVEVDDKTCSTSVAQTAGVGMESFFDNSMEGAFVVGKAEAEAVQFISSRCLMRTEALDGLWNFEGFVLHYDDVPRSVEKVETGNSVLKRRASEPEEPSLALDVLMGDRLGPVLVNLREASVKQFMELMAMVSPSGPKAVMKVTNLRAIPLPKSSWNGKILTPMKILQAGQKRMRCPVSIVTMSRTPLSPYMSSSLKYDVPHQSVCVDFLSMKNRLVAPFRASFLGVVVNAQEVSPTSSGSPKREFDITDKMGVVLHCCALAHNALNRQLQNNMEAVFYYGTGRSAIGNCRGMVYFMKDALIVPVGMKTAVPAQCMEVCIE